MSSIRDIDKRYIGRQIQSPAEDRFSFILSHAKNVEGLPPANIVEFGCACGDFVYWLKREFPSAEITGIDVNPDLIEAAASRVPGATFIQGNLEDIETLPKQRYDMIFMITTHSHFDDCGTWFNNLLDMLTPIGSAFLFGIFNEFDVDVAVRARCASSKGEWMPGWSLISKRTFNDALEQKGFHGTFHKYGAQEAIVSSHDPLAKWTQDLSDGSRQYINGLSQILSFFLLEVRRGRERVHDCG